MLLENHLELHEWTLRPSGEWSPKLDTWTFIRVASGVGYLQRVDAVLELSPGDAVCLAFETAVILRASMLGRMRIQYFDVSTQLLGGMLALAERHYLDGQARQNGSALRFLAASHETAREFTRIAEAKDLKSGLLMRCRLLGLFAGIFDEELAPNFLQAAPKTVRATDRFEQMIREIPESEIRNCSVNELAQKCRCSKRHFSRLFRNYFGASIREKQIELRLEKAKLLLQESDAKVIHVALDSGYQHLSLFNAMFKKHCGMTPTEWRRQSLCKGRRPKRAVRVLALPTGSMEAKAPASAFHG
jgi:AraC-like DNA-binding protein